MIDNVRAIADRRASIASATIRVPAARPDVNHAAALVAVLAASAFGPYLNGSIRCDEPILYGLAVMLFLRTLVVRFATLILAWSVFVACVVIGWAFPPTIWNSPYTPGSGLGNLNNLIAPAAVLVIVSAVVTPANRVALLRRVASVTVLAMSLNALVTLAQLVVPLDKYLVHWWSGSDWSVAQLALTNSRYSGIMNQPAEAGLLYSIALICAIYLFAERPLRMVLILAVLVIGAVLTVSKLFFIAGIPVAGWRFLRLRPKRDRRIVAGGLAGAFAWLAWEQRLVPKWVGVEQLRQQIPHNTDTVLSTLSGGRYGSGSTLHPLVQTVTRDRPLFGFGFTGLNVPYDSAWTEALILGGLAGVLAVAGVFVVLARSCANIRSFVAGPERGLFASLLVILLAGSLGVPVLTNSRAVVVVWLLLGLLISAGHVGGRIDADQQSGAVRL